VYNLLHILFTCSTLISVENISASKIVFILMAGAVVVLTALGMVEPKDFMMLAAMAFSFYFSNKGDPTKEFAGK